MCLSASGILDAIRRGTLEGLGSFGTDGHTPQIALQTDGGAFAIYDCSIAEYPSAKVEDGSIVRINAIPKNPADAALGKEDLDIPCENSADALTIAKALNECFQKGHAYLYEESLTSIDTVAGSEFDDVDEVLELNVQRWMEAIPHELGHVIASHERGGLPASIQIARNTPAGLSQWSDPSGELMKDGPNGRCRLYLARGSSLASDADSMHRLEVIVAGWVADLEINGLDKKEESGRDLERAIELAKTMIEVSGRPIGELIAAAEQSVTEMLKRHRGIMDAGIALAEQRLRENAKTILQLDFELTVLSGSDLDQLLGRS